jgi:hypothetical protein
MYLKGKLRGEQLSGQKIWRERLNAGISFEIEWKQSESSSGQEPREADDHAVR